MIEVKNVYLSYTKDYYTLNNINLKIDDGDKVVLLGENESGKSSLIRLLVSVEKPSSGEVLYDGTPINKVDFKNQVKLGYISTSGAFMDNKTVYKNLEYVLKIRGVGKNDIVQKVNTAILLHKLENISKLKVKFLSDYDKLRVALARLSLRSINYLIVDDVFNDISEEEAKSIMEIVLDIANKNNNCTIVVALENEKYVKELKGDRIVRLKFGSIVE